MFLEFLLPSYFINKEERQAYIIAIAVEAGSSSIQEKEVVMHVILNHAKLPSDNNAYWTILDALGTPSLTNGVLGDASIEDTFHHLACTTYDEGNPYCQTYWLEHYWKPSVEFVDNFFNNPSEDFTKGALYFVHAFGEENAQGIASDMMACKEYLSDYIREHGATPYINGDEIHIASVGITIYTNINILPPLRRYNKNGEKFYDCN